MVCGGFSCESTWAGLCPRLSVWRFPRPARLCAESEVSDKEPLLECESVSSSLEGGMLMLAGSPPPGPCWSWGACGSVRSADCAGSRGRVGRFRLRELPFPQLPPCTFIFCDSLSFCLDGPRLPLAVAILAWEGLTGPLRVTGRLWKRARDPSLSRQWLG